MAIKKTLGGQRVGSGNKMDVELHNYGRSTHNLNRVWRSTMAVGTVIPCFCELALPGDTFDMQFHLAMNTHPTIGPLFGSMKVEIHTYEAPVRLYQGKLHNNAIGVGLKMADIKLPIYTLQALVVSDTDPNFDNAQINPSCLLAYLGHRGVGLNPIPGVPDLERAFQALKILMYYDVCKNYYANKQEEVGAIIHTATNPIVTTVNAITAGPDTIPFGAPTPGVAIQLIDDVITVTFTGTTPFVNQLVLVGTDGQEYLLSELGSTLWETAPAFMKSYYNLAKWGVKYITHWRYITPGEMKPVSPKVHFYPLDDHDKMRDYLLTNMATSPVNITNANLAPYNLLLGNTNGFNHCTQTQEGLFVKTYNSDLFNNWLQTEWIDGPGGINEISAIDVSDGILTIDSLILGRKVYDLLNRIAVSGGTFNDWVEAAWGVEPYQLCTTPMYHGGMVQELVFQEVVNQSMSQGQDGNQPLGTLAGKGVLSRDKKGGAVHIKVKEPSYIMALISITPRIDYSQGNKWDLHLMTMDDFHKPGLDEIGFQELITEQMAWWDTKFNSTSGQWERKSAGKQPAWINYMTAYNETYGNFAIQSEEMFMTLNRRYEKGAFLPNGIKDLTTYIDPTKFNHIFAQTSLDAQNYWAQVGIECTVRRIMSAKVMPNL